MHGDGQYLQRRDQSQATEEEHEDVLLCKCEDDLVLADMTGIGGDMDYCSPHGDDIDDYGPDFICCEGCASL